MFQVDARITGRDRERKVKPPHRIRLFRPDHVTGSVDTIYGKVKISDILKVFTLPNDIRIQTVLERFFKRLKVGKPSALKVAGVL